MAKVGPLRIKVVIDPELVAALARAIAALAAVSEQLNRTDLVKAEIVSEGHGG